MRFFTSLYNASRKVVSFATRVVKQPLVIAGGLLAVTWGLNQYQTGESEQEDSALFLSLASLMTGELIKLATTVINGAAHIAQAPAVNAVSSSLSLQFSLEPKPFHQRTNISLQHDISANAIMFAFFAFARTVAVNVLRPVSHQLLDHSPPAVGISLKLMLALLAAYNLKRSHRKYKRSRRPWRRALYVIEGMAHTLTLYNYGYLTIQNSMALNRACSDLNDADRALCFASRNPHIFSFSHDGKPKLLWLEGLPSADHNGAFSPKLKGPLMQSLSEGYDVTFKQVAGEEICAAIEEAGPISRLVLAAHVDTEAMTFKVIGDVTGLVCDAPVIDNVKDSIDLLGCSAGGGQLIKRISETFPGRTVCGPMTIASVNRTFNDKRNLKFFSALEEHTLVPHEVTRCLNSSP